MAYDDDGTIVLNLNAGVITVYGTATKIAFNGEQYQQVVGWNGLGQYGGDFCMIFPELRDVTHMFRNMHGDSSTQSNVLQVSTDTTTGIDGTWTNSMTSIAYIEPTVPAFRGEHLLPVSANGMKGIRFANPTTGTYTSYRHAQWHVYGNKTAGQTPHRIDFCDSSGNELSIDQDYGDQARNIERVWSPSNTWNQSAALYLKNRSTTKVASDVNVIFEVLYNDMNTYLTLSKDNITYGTTVNYATMNPQAIVGPIYVKHNPTVSAALGVKAGRLQVTVGTWT